MSKIKFKLEITRLIEGEELGDQTLIEVDLSDAKQLVSDEEKFKRFLLKAADNCLQNFDWAKKRHWSQISEES